MPAENRLVSFLALGEGWHNYHHSFPWDYRTGEVGGFGDYSLNFSTFLLDLFAMIGWAYDLKVPDSELVRKTVEKNGDGTHHVWSKHLEDNQNEDNPAGTPIEEWDTERKEELNKLWKTEKAKQYDINSTLMKSHTKMA